MKSVAKVFYFEMLLSVRYLGYWPSLCGQDSWTLAKSFFWVFMDREGVEVHKHAKKERSQYPAILTAQAWLIKDLSYGLIRGSFSCGTWRAVPSRQDSQSHCRIWFILPPQGASHIIILLSSPVTKHFVPSLTRDPWGGKQIVFTFRPSLAGRDNFNTVTSCLRLNHWLKLGCVTALETSYSSPLFFCSWAPVVREWKTIKYCVEIVPGRLSVCWGNFVRGSLELVTLLYMETCYGQRSVYLNFNCAWINFTRC